MIFDFDAKIIVTTAGPARSIIRNTMLTVRSDDKVLLSMLGSLVSKLGDLAPEIRAWSRSNKPQIATRKPALEHERICIEKLLYGRYLHRKLRVESRMLGDIAHVHSSTKMTMHMQSIVYP